MSELSKTRRFKVLDTATLKKVNDHAVQLNQNRSLVDEFFPNVDPEGTHVIGFHMDHVNYEGTPGVRCNIYCKMKGETQPVSVWIDVTHEEFANFAEVTVDSVQEDIDLLQVDVDAGETEGEYTGDHTEDISYKFENEVRPDGPETDRGGLIGQQPY